MMTFVCWLLCILSIWIKVSPAESESWSIEVPDSVLGLKGSCVVIPCQFKYPGGDRKASHLTGMWLTDSNDKVYHTVPSKISSMFQHRTSLLGDLSHRNCSLKINPLDHTDRGPFMFRIEIEDFNKYSYTHNKVTVTVQDSPAHPVLSLGGEINSGKKVTTTCSVLHSCPTDPPNLSWSHRGTVSSQSQQQTKGQWKLTSSLSFTPSKSDNNKQLSCTAEFPGGKTVISKTTLNVKYAPERVEVISLTSVVEGGSLEMNCSSDSNPAPHTYQWFTEAGTMLSEGYTYILKNVSRHTEPIYCTAMNTEGQANSRQTQLNILYPPEIKIGSLCNLETSEVTCLCIVDSQPASNIKWWGADPSLELHRNSQERHGTLTIETIQGVPGFSDVVHCHATNSQGNYTITLRVPHQSSFQSHKAKLLYILIAVAVFVVAIIVLSVWILKNCHRAEPVVTPPQKTEINMTSASDPERKCKDLYPSYDGSQHVYGNLELEEEDYPYECANEYEPTYANV